MIHIMIQRKITIIVFCLNNLKIVCHFLHKNFVSLMFDFKSFTFINFFMHEL